MNISKGPCGDLSCNCVSPCIQKSAEICGNLDKKGLCHGYVLGVCKTSAEYKNGKWVCEVLQKSLERS